MPDFEVLEPALVPSGKPSFLLDWELTMKCNLDCSYCGPIGHDNSTKHPPLQDCLTSIDFMFKYVDLYLKKKSKWSQQVILNVYGGESLFHPNIVEIHQALKEKHAEYSWPLWITTTTNLIVGPNLLERVIPNIDEFTCSYHTESTDKQKEIFKKNLLFLQQQKKKFKVIVLLNPMPGKWEDALSMIEFCKTHQMNFLPRQLDQLWGTRFNYNDEQLKWFQNFYNQKSFNTNVDVMDAKDGNLSQTGRACCGGRQMCTNQNYTERAFFVKDNKFTGWTCSVNWFFLFIKQLTGDVYVNKDCKMNFDGTIGSIGNIKNYEQILNETSEKLEKGIPSITCAKKTCYCGLCAPKAENKEKFEEIFKKYIS